LRAILDDAVPTPDVSFDRALPVTSGGGLLSYLHKVKDGVNIYYFANSSNDRVDTWVSLRGKLGLQQWDPHTGVISPAESSTSREPGREVTRLHLVVDPIRSLFFTEPAATPDAGRR